nr:hypothetical protein [Tanacetum cinerariifolium]
ARSLSIPSEDPYEEDAQQLLEQAPHSPEAAMAQMRAAVPSTYHSLHSSGTPPLLPRPLPVPSTSHITEIPEADTPPRKRLLLTAPKPGYEVEESSAAAARQPGPTMARSIDRVAMRAEIEVLKRKRVAYEQEGIQTREALAKSEAYSRALEEPSYNKNYDDNYYPHNLLSFLCCENCGGPQASLIMRNEEVNTIPEKESDEFIKSSVEDLVPIPSEFEDTSGSESVCILPSCDDFSPIDVLEEKAVTFSNPLFNPNNDFISSDDESLSDEDVSEDNLKIYLNPLFEFDDEYISSDVNPLFDEVPNIQKKDKIEAKPTKPSTDWGECRKSKMEPKLKKC